MPQKPRSRLLPPRSYQLTAATVAASVGAGVVCLADAAIGRTFRLHAARPGPERNRAIWHKRQEAEDDAAEDSVSSGVIRVDISGPIEQRAGYHDPCGGWTDGNDAIAERMIAALEVGDVLLVLDTPGGACAGVQQAIARVQAAKAAHGRRVIGWADEMIASLGMWWALAVCDELYLPLGGQLGSIGAKSGHVSVAAALEREGQEVTFFAWPDEGKIAFAPERALSDIGRERGERDVRLAGEAFCAAVIESAIGKRNKLTRKGVMGLSADMLTGRAAVDAGLADGVATFEEVTEYALSLAREKDSRAQARAHGGRMPLGKKARAKTRAEDDEKDKEARRLEEEERAEDMPEAEEPEAEEEDAEEPEAEDDEPPPSSKKDARAPSARGSMASLLGLPEDASLPAQKAAVLSLQRVVTHAAKLTGATGTNAILSGLDRIAKDAELSSQRHAEVQKLQAVASRKERWALCHSLVRAGYPRASVFADEIDEETGTRKAVALTPVYKEMRLDTLRDLAKSEKPVERNPFEPDADGAREESRVARAKATGTDEDSLIAAAMKSPNVIAAHARSGGAFDLKTFAAEWVSTQRELRGAR